MTSHSRRDILSRFDEMLKRGREKTARQEKEPSSKEAAVESRREESIRMMVVRGTLHWGFVVRIPGSSAAQLALPIAPPTTIVGSISSPLFKLLGLRDIALVTERQQRVLNPFFDCALRATLTASMGLTPVEGYEGSGICIYQEASRINAALYKAGGSWNEALEAPLGSIQFYSKFATESMPVQAMGAAYGPGATLDLAWVFDVFRLADCLSGLKVKISPSDIDEAGLIASYAVTRLGSKEGVFSVDKAAYGGVETIYEFGDVVSTHLYTPVECVQPAIGEGQSSVIKLWGLSYEPVNVYVPGRVSGSLVTPPEKSWLPRYRIVNRYCRGYAIKLDGEEIVSVSRGYHRISG